MFFLSISEMKVNGLFFIILVTAPVIGYLFFYKYIESYWEDFDKILTITSFVSGMVIFYYNSNLKFHFFLNRLLTYFTKDYNIWTFSTSFTIENLDEMEMVEQKLLEGNIKIENITQNTITFKYDRLNQYRLRFSPADSSIHLISDKIVVPNKRIKVTVREFRNLVEKMNEIFRSKVFGSDQYELGIEYKSNPMFSYALKKIPEENIISFNLNIQNPANNYKLKSSGNSVYLTSNKLEDFVEVVNNYNSLQFNL